MRVVLPEKNLTPSAALILRYLKIRTKKFRIRVLAVDIDSKAIEFAQKGIYSRNQLTGLDPKLISTCFSSIGGSKYQVRNSMQEMVEFQKHDTLESQFIKTLFDLIRCHNVLIYFSRRCHFKAYKQFSCQLHTGGYLVLGMAEIMFYPGKNHFELAGIENHIYKKKASEHIKKIVDIFRGARKYN